MSRYIAIFRDHQIPIDAPNEDRAYKEGLAYMIRYAEPKILWKEMIIKPSKEQIIQSMIDDEENHYYDDSEKVYNPRDIVDGKFLEDYFYNS